MNPITIVYVVPFWTETKGGPTTYVFHLAEKQRMQMNKVKILTWGNGEGAITIGNGGILGIYTQYKQFFEISPDIIHIHSKVQSIAPALLYRLTKKPECKIIFTFHTMPSYKQYLNGDSSSPTGYFGWKGLLAKFLLNACDRITSVSHSIVKSLNQNEVLNIRSYDVVSSASDIFTVDKDQTKIAQKNWFPNNGHPILCTVGVLSWDWKVAGHMICIDAVKELIDDYPNIRLAIAGDGRYRNFLERYIQTKKLENHIILVGNINNIPTFISCGDLYVHMGLNEGSPHSIIEAMMIGKPIIGANCGGIPELVIDRKNGLLIEPDSERLASSVKELLADSDLRNLISHNAATHARSYLTWDHISDEYVRIYRDLFKQTK